MFSQATDFFDRAYRKHKRYWLRDNLNSTDPADFPPPWSDLLRALATRSPGYALDLGAGEGADAIRLARLGYEVDAVEGSAAGAEKVEAFAHEAGVRVNAVHADARIWLPAHQYDVVICNGLLHYLTHDEKRQVLSMVQQATRAGGYNLAFLFSDRERVPECHRVVDLYCDSRENGIVSSCYDGWDRRLLFEDSKVDTAHVDFPPHRHSHIKILAQNTVPPGSAEQRNGRESGQR